jgi:hypothetical protein
MGPQVNDVGRQAEGGAHREATRALKRRLSDVITANSAPTRRSSHRPRETKIHGERDRTLI